ncbi:MAG: hypothetical protein WCK77_22940 [Verrucomicrobiota bacterium]
MKKSIIRSTWLAKGGYRLDCSPYLGGALEALVLLEELTVRKDPLGGVTSAILNIGRIKRQWVETLAQGTPFLSGSSIQLAEFTNISLISNKAVRDNPLLLIKRGTTLITRSGSIGKMAYVREDMEGMACTEDVLRVVPDTAKIPSGYLYAYLSSKFGIPLITSGTYGGIIQHLEPEHIADLPVPRLGNAMEQEIHRLIEQAASLRVKATVEVSAARDMIRRQFGEPPHLEPGKRHAQWAGHAISSKRLSVVRRMDALYYNPISCELDEWLAQHTAGSYSLGEVAEVFDVPPFKHIYVGHEEGVPFFTSADLFSLDRTTDKYLSTSQTKGLNKYILKRDWVLIARSGQLNGNIGLPQYVDSGLAEKAASDHVIRIVPRNDRFSAGYIYAYLSLPEWRYALIQRTATGASIPALWPLYLKQLRILRPSKKLNNEVGMLVCSALERRVNATMLELKAQKRLEQALTAKANLEKWPK